MGESDSKHNRRGKMSDQEIKEQIAMDAIKRADAYHFQSDLSRKMCLKFSQDLSEAQDKIATSRTVDAVLLALGPAARHHPSLWKLITEELEKLRR